MSSFASEAIRAVSQRVSSFATSLSSAGSSLMLSMGVSSRRQSEGRTPERRQSKIAKAKVVASEVLRMSSYRYTFNNEGYTESEVEREEMIYFKERYSMGKQIGKGHFSIVRAAKDNQTGKHVAIKIITKSALSAKDEEGLVQEIMILDQLNHPNIVQFFGHYQDKHKHFLVLEKVEGGELFDRIVEKKKYSENDARQVVIEIAKAIEYCHERGIAHRDLKPENILLASMHNDTFVKIADFGFAKFESDSLHTALGTPGYIAPEVLSGQEYSVAVDMWSLGVIIYILLCGYPPFHSNNRKTLFRKIREGAYEFHAEFWGGVSFFAKDLVSRLLVVNPSERYTIDQLLGHPWISNESAEGKRREFGSVDITPALERLKKYQARKRLRKSQNVASAVYRFMRTESAQLLFGKHSRTENLDEMDSFVEGHNKKQAYATGVREEKFD